MRGLPCLSRRSEAETPSKTLSLVEGSLSRGAEPKGAKSNRALPTPIPLFNQSTIQLIGREVHPAQQVPEARVVAQGVKDGVDLEEEDQK